MEIIDKTEITPGMKYNVGNVIKNENEASLICQDTDSQGHARYFVVSLSDGQVTSSFCETLADLVEDYGEPHDELVVGELTIKRWS